jgi:hypothetical protein
MDSFIHCLALGLLAAFLIRLTFSQGRSHLIAQRRIVAATCRRRQWPRSG